MSSAGTEREENTATVWQQDRVRPVHRVLISALPTDRVSTGADKGWVLKCGVWRADPGRGMLWVVRRHPEGTGVREELYKLECLWRKTEPPESRVPLLSDAHREDHHCRLSPPVLAAPPPALGRAATWVGSIELQPLPPSMHLLHNQQTPVLWGSF